MNEKKVEARATANQGKRRKVVHAECHRRLIDEQVKGESGTSAVTPYVIDLDEWPDGVRCELCRGGKVELRRCPGSGARSRLVRDYTLEGKLIREGVYCYECCEVVPFDDSRSAEYQGTGERVAAEHTHRVEYLGDAMPKWVADGAIVKVKSTPFLRKAGIFTYGSFQAKGDDRAFAGERGTVSRAGGKWWHWEVRFERRRNVGLDEGTVKDFVVDRVAAGVPEQEREDW